MEANKGNNTETQIIQHCHILAFLQVFAHFKNTSDSLELRHIIFNKTQKMSIVCLDMFTF